MMFSRVTAVVKEEHSDVFRHLNNSHYDSYFELGRNALQEKYGIDNDTLGRKGFGLWVQDTYIQRKKQVRPGDKIVVESRFIGKKGPMLYMLHLMKADGDEKERPWYAGGELALCISEHFFVNTGKDNPAVVELPFMMEKVDEICLNDGPLPKIIYVLEYFDEKRREYRIEQLRKKGNNN